jgi:protein-disulfide isomerase
MANERTAGSRLSSGVGLAGSLLLVFAGLVASAMLVVDYVRPMPVFCSEGGGCEALKHTAIATPLGVPLPLFGLAGFLAIGVAALLRGQRARLAQLGLAVVAGMVGMSLLVLQFRLGTFCPYCCIADASGVLSALVAGARLWLAGDAPAPRVLTYAGAVVLVVAPAVPLVLGFRASPLPQVIRDEMAQTPHGVVTVVDFVDFECPFCRITHPELRAVLQAHPGKVRVVRREVPLKMHPHAMDAARSECCAEKLGKGESMANALFTAPAEELTPEGCEKIAREVGLPLEAYRACVADPATDALIAADKAEFQAAGGFALPTLWVDEVPLVGAQPEERIEEAVTAAMARAGS